MDTLTASNFAGIYWPHLVVGDVAGVGRNPTITLPPSGYVAGLFARIDGRRGVWKAPAGTEATLNATIAIEYQLTDLHSDELNPKGVNALRQIPGAGRVVWGARTMIPSSEWRYVPVRRTAIYLRTSIYNGIQWAVFEPNEEPLWSSLRATIGGFMETQFRNGAFAGRTSNVPTSWVDADDDRNRPGSGASCTSRRVRSPCARRIRRGQAQPEGQSAA
jgi:phage tail sheath protein FI